MVCAVVEVLVAEEAAPALVAVALVRLLAGAVHAAGVADALVAEPPRPALLAPGENKRKFGLKYLLFRLHLVII